MLLTEVGEGGVSISFKFVACRIGKGGMLLRDGSDKGIIPGTSPELMAAEVDDSVREKVGGDSDVGGMESPLTIGSVGKGPVFGVVGRGRTLLMEGSNNGEIESALKTGPVGNGPIVGAVGKGRTLVTEGGGKVKEGSSVSVGSASKGIPVAGGFNRPSERRRQIRSLQPNGRPVAVVGAGVLPVAGGSKRPSETLRQIRSSQPNGRPVAVVGAGVLPVAGGFKRPSERLRHKRSLQLNGRPVAVVGAGESERLSERTTQNRESHVRGSAEDPETGETAGGSGNQFGGGNSGGGGCNGLLGSRGGSGAGGINGLSGFKGGGGGGGIHGLLGSM